MTDFDLMDMDQEFKAFMVDHMTARAHGEAYRRHKARLEQARPRALSRGIVTDLCSYREEIRLQCSEELSLAAADDQGAEAERCPRVAAVIEDGGRGQPIAIDVTVKPRVEGGNLVVGIGVPHELEQSEEPFVLRLVCMDDASDCNGLTVGRALEVSPGCLYPDACFELGDPLAALWSDIETRPPENWPFCFHLAKPTR